MKPLPHVWLDGSLEQEEALLGFLRSCPSEALADRLLAIAYRDDQIARELSVWYALRSLPTWEDQDIRNLIDDSVTRTKLPSRSTLGARYAAHVSAAVLPILTRLQERDPHQALTISVHALGMFFPVMNEILDADMEMARTARTLAKAFIEALEACGDQPAHFAHTYADLVSADPIGCLDHAVAQAAMGSDARMLLATLMQL